MAVRCVTLFVDGPRLLPADVDCRLTTVGTTFELRCDLFWLIAGYVDWLRLHVVPAVLPTHIYVTLQLTTDYARSPHVDCPCHTDYGWRL